MGRRSDHSRAELAEMIIAEGHRQMAEAGFARFSAREVAKRIGYSIGTVYNVFGTHDRLVSAINTRTFQLWAAHLRKNLEGRRNIDRIRELVYGYFTFARENPNLWMAIYDHRLPTGAGLSEEEHAQRGELTQIVADEIAAVLPRGAQPQVPRLARSLVAIVHGHCDFTLNGSFALMGEEEPVELALERVRETIAAEAKRWSITYS